MAPTAADRARSVMSRAHQSPHEVLRAWDKGGKPFRSALMSIIVDKCTGMSEAELEEQFGQAASLVLTRFCAWLRVTFGQSDTTSTQILRAIQVFVAPGISVRFIVEFVEQGGALTALEFLSTAEGHAASKTVALELLLTVAQAGDKFQVVLRECDATKYVNHYIEGDGKDVELAADLLSLLKEHHDGTHGQ
eukprot:m.62220 g.62220  ORF g.62220 m.62220 type:complete len:192 (-) comp8070_c0_seq2:2816-3391(-)